MGSFPFWCILVHLRATHDCLSLDAQALSTLSSISQGDLRHAITYLQSAARLFGSSISSSDLISVSGVIPCKSGDFDVANKEVSNVIAEGYPVSQLILQFLDVIVNADDISDEQKAKICEKLGEADKGSEKSNGKSITKKSTAGSGHANISKLVDSIGPLRNLNYAHLLITISISNPM